MNNSVLVSGVKLVTLKQQLHSSILGPLLFLVYINDLPMRINSLAEPMLFADDTSVIISNRNFTDFSTSANLVLTRMTEWFSANMLVLNLEKTNIMNTQFIHQQMHIY